MGSRGRSMFVIVIHAAGRPRAPAKLFFPRGTRERERERERERVFLFRASGWTDCVRNGIWICYRHLVVFWNIPIFISFSLVSLPSQSQRRWRRQQRKPMYYSAHLIPFPSPFPAPNPLRLQAYNSAVQCRSSFSVLSA